MRVAVVVLGDLGRSPRMLYHARALADSIGHVELVGYVESDLDPAVRDHPDVHVRPLRAPRVAPHLPAILFLLHGLLRVLRQAVALLWLLLRRIERPDVVLVQNPPAVPALLACLLAARARSARLIIDWHNFGWAMLALRLGPQHPVVRLARRYEEALGRRADAHLCVSRAMAAALAADFGIADAVVLHDRPAERFVPTAPAVRRRLLDRLGPALRLPDRPFALLVSPSSWTADDDVDLLLDAAAQCDATMGEDAQAYPDLLIVLTGHGPLHAQYAGRMASLALHRVHLRTLWLTPEDYALFLGSADLGLSLHRSASGLDLPMKIADLLGAGVPVCALDYAPCLAEQLRHGDTGLLFRTSAELAEQLATLFRGFPEKAPVLAHLRRNVARAAGDRWVDEWTSVARPLFWSAG